MNWWLLSGLHQEHCKFWILANANRDQVRYLIAASPSHHECLCKLNNHKIKYIWYFDWLVIFKSDMFTCPSYQIYLPPSIILQRYKNRLIIIIIIIMMLQFIRKWPCCCKKNKHPFWHTRKLDELDNILSFNNIVLNANRQTWWFLISFSESPFQKLNKVVKNLQVCEAAIPLCSCLED